MVDLAPITTPVLQPMEYWAVNACTRYYPWRTVEEAVKSTEGESDVETITFTS